MLALVLRVRKTNETPRALVWRATRWPSLTLQGKAATLKKEATRPPIQFCLEQTTIYKYSKFHAFLFWKLVFIDLKKMITFLSHHRVFWCGFWNKRDQNLTKWNFPEIASVYTFDVYNFYFFYIKIFLQKQVKLAVLQYIK